MSGSKGGEASAPFVFVRQGDPQPTEWLARHPKAVRIPARLVTRPAARSPAVPQQPASDVQAGPEAAGGSGPAPRQASAGAPPVRRRLVPVHRLPTGSGSTDATHPIAVYPGTGDAQDRAATTYVAGNPARVVKAASAPADHGTSAAHASQQDGGTGPHTQMRDGGPSRTRQSGR